MMKVCLSLLTVLVLAGCLKENQGGDTDMPAQSYTDAAYGGDLKQKMDIYLPKDRTIATTKVIILIHGGGWTTGDKTDFTQYVDTLKKRLAGYAIFNINYRLAAGSSNLFPTQENDVKAAIEYIYAKRNEYSISDKFVLLGASAGAHLALLHAYKYTTPVKIKAVVDFFGPADLTAMYNNPASVFAPPAAIAAVAGATPASNPTLYQQSSPIRFVTAQSAPTIILQGGADLLVSPSQSAALQTKLQTMSVINQYIFYPAETHGWIGADLTHSFNAIGDFLEANVN